MIAALAGGCVVGIWGYVLAGRGMFWRMREAEPLPAPVRLARVAVVIPARNEAETIGASLGSIVQQDYAGPFQVFLVDDHSEDGTAEVARRSVSPDRVRVVAAGPLPDGWTGKLWALEAGVVEAEPFRPDYILFSDADILHAPDGISQLVARAETGGYDLVSEMVKLECRTFAEKALIPAFVFFFFMLYPPERTRNPRRRTAGAAGGCILLRSAALVRIGGLAAIRGELIDDCALAKAVKTSGGKVWLGLTSKTRSIRGYGTLDEIGRMISRTAFWQLGHSAVLLVGTVAGMFLTYLAPPLLLLTGMPFATACGAAAWLIMAAVYIPALRFYGLTMLRAPLLPLVALFYTGATIHSAVRYWTGRGGEWKGRVQDARQV